MSNFAANKGSGGGDFLKKLQNIKIGGGRAKGMKIKKRDMIFILRNISILIENGLSLPKSLETLVTEKSLKKYSSMLEEIKSRVENGEAFSDTLTSFPEAFHELIVTQIRIGERSGTMPLTLGRILHQLEHADNLKGVIIKKLSYPCILVTAGSGAITFMLLYVIPTFQGIYEESGAKLPGITRLLIYLGEAGTQYGWMVVLGIVALVSATVTIRRQTAGRLWMDTWLLRVPLLGRWFKNMSVLQFMEVLGNLMDAGFTVVEALESCSKAVGNRAIRQSITEMHEALTRGERFSDELARHEDLFPPVVKQLVVVGEKTGTLSKTTVHIRAHLRREVETYTNVMLGAIEPTMTAGLAVCIGGMVLAIYLPMFDMIGAMK
ncbi:MAG: type II secretion system F family protein [Planctomycetota bacterium]|nr:type II secretion system F family protein [Planctomycetota bacterium]